MLASRFTSYTLAGSLYAAGLLPIAAQPTPPTVHIVDTQSGQPIPYASVVQRLDSGGTVGYAPHGVSR
jgi:hypothetical protein